MYTFIVHTTKQTFHRIQFREEMKKAKKKKLCTIWTVNVITFYQTNSKKYIHVDFTQLNSTLFTDHKFYLYVLFENCHFCLALKDFHTHFFYMFSYNVLKRGSLFVKFRLRHRCTNNIPRPLI